MNFLYVMVLIKVTFLISEIKISPKNNETVLVWNESETRVEEESVKIQEAPSDWK